MKIYKLEEYESELLSYSANEECIATQYSKLLENKELIKKLSLKRLRKYINLIINSYTDSFFSLSIANIFIRRNSEFENYRFDNTNNAVYEVL